MFIFWFTSKSVIYCLCKTLKCLAFSFPLNLDTCHYYFTAIACDGQSGDLNQSRIYGPIKEIKFSLFLVLRGVTEGFFVSEPRFSCAH